MMTPILSAGQSLVRATLEILVPKVDDPIIPLRFNPTEYQLQKQNNFAEIAIPGLESPPIQFIRGGCEKLVVELLVDTSDTLEDVRERYTKKLRNLMCIKEDIHAPPIVRLVWDTQVFKGVIESMNISYVMFTPEGVPIRAKLNVTLKEYRPVEIQVRENRKASPDRDKTHTVRLGDALWSIAAAAYTDPAAWRDIARANGIKDPRRLKAGIVLSLPRLR